MRRSIVSLVMLLVLASLLRAQSLTIIPSKEKDWPQWRGPRRDGICDEKGLLADWPEGGPKVLWTTSNIGSGYSAPIIAGGMIYITGDVGDELHIFALDFDGKLRWKAKNGKSWKNPYPGSRSSCTYESGRLYHANAHGRVACLDAATGAEVWSVDILDRFDAKTITWGLSENLLIDGDHIIVTPGGKKALMAALDKKTGQTVWSTPPLLFGPENKPDPASYCSPVLLEVGGKRHIVAVSSQHIFGVDPDTGQLSWTSPMPTRYQVLSITPVVCPGGVFMTGPDSQGGYFYRLSVEAGQVRAQSVWTTPLDTCHGGVIYLNGFLYGSFYRALSGWGCVDVATGQVPYRTKDLAMGSALYADGRFYCLAQDGRMALVQADEKSFSIISHFRLTSAKVGDAWTHPVIHNGRLYLRYHDKLHCYSLK